MLPTLDICIHLLDYTAAVLSTTSSIPSAVRVPAPCAGPARRFLLAHTLSHMPTNPPGDARTITRKITPMMVSNRSGPSQSPTLGSQTREELSMRANTNAPIHAPSRRYRPPTTAMMRMLIVIATLTPPGETWVVYHTDRMPA